MKDFSQHADSEKPAPTSPADNNKDPAANIPAAATDWTPCPRCGQAVGNSEQCPHCGHVMRCGGCGE